LDLACGNDKTKLDPDDQPFLAAMTADLTSGDSLGAEPEALMAAGLATIPSAAELDPQVKKSPSATICGIRRHNTTTYCGSVSPNWVRKRGRTRRLRRLLSHIRAPAGAVANQTSRLQLFPRCVALFPSVLYRSHWGTARRQG